MNNTKHTPGPWELSESENGRPCIDAIDPKDNEKFELCIVYGESYYKQVTDQAQANARLIAAAPELLSACMLTRDWMTAGQPGPHTDEQLLELLNTAIAKATRD